MVFFGCSTFSGHWEITSPPYCQSVTHFLKCIHAATSSSREESSSITALLSGFQHPFIMVHENKTTTPSITASSQQYIMSLWLQPRERRHYPLSHRATRLCSLGAAALTKRLWLKFRTWVGRSLRLMILFFAWNLRRLLLYPMEKRKWSSVRNGEAKVQSHFYSEDNGPRFLSLSLHLMALLCCEKWWKVVSRMKEALQLRNGH